MPTCFLLTCLLTTYVFASYRAWSTYLLTYFFYFLQSVVDLLSYRLLYFLQGVVDLLTCLLYFLQGVVDTAQDGECSSKDSATQWMDCGIPCPVGEEVTLLLAPCYLLLDTLLPY